MTNIFQDNWTKPWNTLNFNGDHLIAHELGEDNLPNAYAELGYAHESVGVEFGVVDYLDDFHKPHNYINPNLLTPDGWLTREALNKIQKFYQEQLQSDRYCGVKNDITELVEVDDYMGDEPHYVVSILVPYNTEGTVEEIFDKYVSNFFACVQNVTDPGTFNEPYIFNEVQ